MSESTQKPWQTVRTEPGPDLVIFKSRFDWVVNPRNGKSLKAIVLEARDWVNVVAKTPDDKLVVVSQYRFGNGRISLEIPAGLVDPGETPLQAAQRELLEETGYSAREWRPLGWTFANPAFLNNRAHSFLATGLERSNEPTPEDGEDLVVSELTLDEIRRAIREERMRNTMTVLALSRVFDLRDE